MASTKAIIKQLINVVFPSQSAAGTGMNCSIIYLNRLAINCLHAMQKKGLIGERKLSDELQGSGSMILILGFFIAN